MSDHAVALEDRGALRYVAVRYSPASAPGLLTWGYVWLGDRILGPGEQHTMSRTVAHALAPDDDTLFTAVIAESGDSFNRLVRTAEVLAGIAPLTLPRV